MERAAFKVDRAAFSSSSLVENGQKMEDEKWEKVTTTRCILYFAVEDNYKPVVWNRGEHKQKLSLDQRNSHGTERIGCAKKV